MGYHQFVVEHKLGYILAPGNFGAGVTEGLYALGLALLGVYKVPCHPGAGVLPRPWDSIWYAIGSPCYDFSGVFVSAQVVVPSCYSVLRSHCCCQ